MKRGDIYFIDRGFDERGSEQRAGRPAIIVSNDKCNESSRVIEVVYLTTQPKTDLPTHIDIRSTSKPSIALCEQVTSVFVDRVGDYMGTCSEYEMAMIDAGLAISLGLEFDAPKKEKDVAVPKAVEPKPVTPDNALKEKLQERDAEVIKLTAERDTYKALYEAMLERLVAAK